MAELSAGRIAIGLILGLTTAVVACGGDDKVAAGSGGRGGAGGRPATRRSAAGAGRRLGWRFGTAVRRGQAARRGQPDQAASRTPQATARMREAGWVAMLLPGPMRATVPWQATRATEPSRVM